MDKGGVNQVFVSVFVVLIIISVIPLASSSLGDWIKSKITGKATSQPLNINISVSSRAPNETWLYYNNTLSLTENTGTPFYINLTAFDPDGSSNLDSNGASINITKSGATTRSNSTCQQTSTWGTYYANYTCTIYVQYYDDYGKWDIGASIADTSGSYGYNISANMTVNQLTAFVSSPSALTFPSINPGVVNTTSNNDPVTMNNTGNDPIAVNSIDVNATNLVGETDNSKALYANNFTIHWATGSNVECGTDASNMSRSVYSAIGGANLTNGNHSVVDGYTGQEQLYFCLKTTGSELTQQYYSTYNQGAWTMRIQ